MEWKELQIDNLPPDILTANYEFMLDNEEIGYIHKRDRANIFDNLILNDGKYRYRKPEPKQPTHEEILQRVKKELNIQIDTKIADMKKTIIWHMNNLYDSIVLPEA